VVDNIGNPWFKEFMEHLLLYVKYNNETFCFGDTTGLRTQFEHTQLSPTGKEFWNICNEGLEYNTVQYDIK